MIIIILTINMMFYHLRYLNLVYILPSLTESFRMPYRSRERHEPPRQTDLLRSRAS